MQSQRYDNYNIKIGLFRVVLVILVIIGHAGINVQFFSEVKGNNELFYSLGQINSIIYQFHMPAFMMLSGYCYIKYTRKQNAAKQLHKLLYYFILQYIIELLQYWPICKAGSSGITPPIQVEHPIQSYLVNQFLNQNHMWFMTVYIVNSLLALGLQKVFRTRWSSVLLAINSLLYVIYIWVCANNIYLLPCIDVYIKNQVWFQIGLAIYDKDILSKVNPKQQSVRIVTVAFVWITIVTFLYGITNFIQSLVYLACGLLGQACLYMLIELILSKVSRENKDKLQKTVRGLDKYSLTAYIVGGTVQSWWLAIWMLTIADGKPGEVIRYRTQDLITLQFLQILFQIVGTILIFKLINKVKNKCGDIK